MNQSLSQSQEEGKKKDQEIEQLKNDNSVKEKQINAISGKYSSVLDKWTKAAEFLTKDEPELNLDELVSIPE